MRKEKHIYTVFDELIDQSEKENLLGQRGVTIWLTGLSGSGKSTLASYLERSLHKQGRLSTVLDGDNIRSGLNGDLSFSQEDRSENIRRIAEVSKLFNQAGVICINSFVSPTHDIRAKAKSIIGDRFIEVFVDTPLEICEERDVKGLYALARKGEIKNFTGIDSPFEAPKNPEIVTKTEGKSLEESGNELVQQIINYINLKDHAIV